MGCKASKEDVVQMHRVVSREGTPTRPKKAKKSGHASNHRKKNTDLVIKLDEVANASGSDWGELVNEMAVVSSLQNAKRRRLSISTVHGPMEVSEFTGSQAERRRSLAMDDKTKSKFIKDASISHLIPGMTGQRTQIKRTEFAKLLQNGRASFEVSDHEQLQELFPKSKFFGVFGDAPDDTQAGFDNKIHGMIGNMPKGMLLQDVGVGYTCRKGLKPESPNQDDFFVLRVDDWSMYGVFDGHGPYGHAVSGFVHRTLPYLIVSDPDFFTDLPKCLRQAFHKCNALCAIASDNIDKLYDQEDERYWDCMMSGTTVTIAVAREDLITIAHVGDSRVIAGSQKDFQDGRGPQLQVHELSTDHKPQDKAEKARIVAAGGEVLKLEGDIPHRVFCKGKQYPGLAMSRALGDALSQSIGVSCDPDITEYKRSSDDLFIVMASDGVWEFMTNREVAQSVHKKGFQGCQKSADSCSIESWKRWLMEEHNVVDDITCLVIWNESHMKLA